MLNLITVQGNLTKDITKRDINETMKVASGTMALNIFRKGEKRAIFLDLELWNNLVDEAVEKGHKGRTVLVIGKLWSEEWTDKLGNLKTKFGITVQQIEFIQRITTTPTESNESNDSTESAEVESQSEQKTIPKETTKKKDAFEGFGKDAFDLPF